MKNEIILENVEETRKWARSFARGLAAPRAVALHGDLGMGKSEIARAIIQELCGADTVVPSPTFTLVQTYDIPSGHRIPDNFARSAQNFRDDIKISHFDLYRIEDVAELEEIGLNHAIENDIALIEWPEIAAAHLPANTIHIHIQEYEGGRKIDIR